MPSVTPDDPPSRYPQDDFGAHLTEPLGTIGDRTIGVGHVVLSEDRYAWLLDRAKSADDGDAWRLAAERVGRDYSHIRQVGTALAAAAMHVVGEYDGLHRLSLAVAAWATAVAGEDGRSEMAAPVPIRDGVFSERRTES